MSRASRNELTRMPSVGSDQMTAMSDDRDAQRQAAHEDAPLRGQAAAVGSRRSCRHPLLADVADVDERQRQHGQEEDHGQHRAAPLVEELEGLQVHLVSHHVRVEAAARHDVDDVEDLEHDDGRRDGDHDQGAPDHGHGDPEELLALAGSVQAGGLGDLRGHALDGGRQDDHGEAGLEPDEDDDEGERADVVVGRLVPGHGLLSQARPDGVQEAVSAAWPSGFQAYTKRQMTDAPTSEMASGRKTKVLATDSYLTRSNEGRDEQAEARPRRRPPRPARGCC